MTTNKPGYIRPVPFIQQTPAQRFQPWLDKGSLVPDPSKIFGASAPLPLVKLAAEARCLSDRLMAGIGDAILEVPK